MSFQGLYISVTGMQASQAGLNITNQNIANTNTPNYSRKLVNQNDANTMFVAQKDLPSGVFVEDISRAKNFFLDLQYRNHVSSLGYHDELSKLSANINDLLGKPGNITLNEKLQNFFTAANDLTANPELETLRTTFVNSAQALTESFNETDSSIAKIKEDVDAMPNGGLNTKVKQLNDTLSSIGSVQKQINLLRAVGQDATSLQDQRDGLLDKLSELIDFDVKLGQDGEFYQIRTKLYPTEAGFTGTATFLNPDTVLNNGASVPPTITEGVNNVLNLTINNGNGATTTFAVNLQANSTTRETIDRINQSFRNNGGQGSIASLNEDNQISLDLRLVDNSVINSTSAISINAGSTATNVLGLPAAPSTSTGTSPLDVILLDTSAQTYQVELETGNDKSSPHPAKLMLSKNGVQMGTILPKGGRITGLIDATNSRIPEMRQEISDFAMGIKDLVNGILQVGNTTTGAAGVPLFTGNSAKDFAVASNVLADTTLIAIGQNSPGGIGVGDNSVIEELSQFFFADKAILSDTKQAEKLFIRAGDPLIAPATNSPPLRSKLAIVAGDPLNVTLKGLINDNGTMMNAGANNLGGNSLVQIEFLAADGTTVLSTVNPNTGNPPPDDSISWSGNAPAGAAFVQFRVNGTSFNDNDLSDNYGHFDIEVYQNNNGLSSSFNSKMAKTVGNLGQQASIDKENRDTSSYLESAIENQRQSTSGVSLEEEAANLLVYQNAFAANARAFSTMNSLLDEIMRLI
jgi:flagellar hook-associated protein FlgK